MALVKSGTLTAGAATTTTVGNAGNGVWVENLTQGGVIFARGDGTATTFGDDCWPVLGRRYIPRDKLTLATDGTATISLVSTAALMWSVQAGEAGDDGSLT